MIIAGVSSGVGKTTVTLALLSCLMKRGLKVQSFKVGPDYIDPMFHYYVTGKYCRNLDPFLTSDDYVKSCFFRHIQDVNYTVIEGVMGFFDGVKIADHYGDFRDNYFASTAYIAQLLNLPVILVIDCSKLSGSVAAIAHGYRSLIPDINLGGVILNRVGSERHLELLKSALDCFQISILGVFYRQDNINIPSRHLGLIPTGEIHQLNSLIDRLAHLGESCFNWDLLLPLLQCSNFSPHPPSPSPSLRLSSTSLTTSRSGYGEG
ncbi:MAG TPA: cobyrinate a,c-diamide synthase, partial [Allocoleopsis sp.]